jgi:2-oxoglutarate ferredoxin oxidoreductase subunit gamma
MSMHSEIVLAGFGGQGVLLIGKLLAYAGMKAGHEVTWFPAYGPEMRGGTCNCTVVLSNAQVGSPISRNPHGLIVLNLQSIDKFEPELRPGGVMAFNTSLINRPANRTDIIAVPVPANQIAVAAGSAKAANMVALGAYLGASNVLDFSLVMAGLNDLFSARQKLVALNQVCLQQGYQIGQAASVAAAAR